MTLPPKTDQTMLHVRLDKEMLAELDKAAARLAEQTPGLSVSRADVVRIALRAWLAEQPKPRAK